MTSCLPRGMTNNNNYNYDDDDDDDDDDDKNNSSGYVNHVDVINEHKASYIITLS